MNNNYWEHKIDYIVNKYMQMMKDNNVIYSDVYIGVNSNYKYSSLDAYRRYKVADNIIISLCAEIDKFPRFYRGIICAKLKKFKL
jgi:hypothetical protein